MLSGISQFLFGGSESEESVPHNSIFHEHEDNLATSPVENEWVLVDNAGRQECHCCRVTRYRLVKSYNCIHSAIKLEYTPL